MKVSHPGFLIKVIYLTLFLTTHSTTAFTQCSSFVLVSQQDVDQFPVNFGCTVLTGQLLINGDGITNLNALSAITHVQWLTIANTSLTNLSGLDALQTIEGGFDLHDNPLLTSVQGLQNLASVGYIDIRLNAQLTDISQLSKLTTTGSPILTDGNLIIRDCPMLTTLNGLQNIMTVNGFLWIEHNAALQDLNALNKLSTVTKTMWINDNDALIDLSGLENLTNVNRLGIVEHASLINLRGLNGLSLIPGGLVIRNNSSLSDLTGLENLTTVGVEFSIQTNPLVSIESLNSLQAVGGNPDDNGPQGLLLDNLPELISLQGLDHLMSVSGNVLVDDVDKISDLTGLDNLKMIDGSLTIRFNNALSGLGGISKLERIGRNLQITNNLNLANCAADGICVYLRMNPGLAFIAGNASSSGCNNEAQILLHCSPLNEFNIVDANALFLKTSPFIKSIELDASALGITAHDKGDVDDCPPGLCPLSVVLQQDFFDTLNFGCLFPLLIPAGTELGLDNVQHYNFSSGDNYCLCVYKYDAQIGAPCDTFTYNYKIRGPEIHFHLLGDKNCEKWDTTWRAGGPYPDTQYPDELYYGHPELIAKVQCYSCDFFGWDQLLDKILPKYELVRDVTSPRGCIQLTTDLIDGNLSLDMEVTQGGMDIRDLDRDELLLLDEIRDGVTADGVSTVLLRMQFVEKGHISLAVPSIGFEMPWGDSTYQSGNNHYAFILFTPPETFNPQEITYLLNQSVEAHDHQLNFDFNNGNETRSLTKSIPLVRPPVVLVHGTYSNPDKAWKTSVDGGVSMYDQLTQSGFKVFAVNYEESNGTSGLVTDYSSFTDNAKVVWGDVYASNTDGIKDALTYYRDELHIATTQADVVGHSLGGVLARVYASENYNPEYKRPENFMQGDINRLITLASTHFGSHLGELQLFLNGLSPFDIGAFDWIVLQAVNTISEWAGGASPSAAVMDQLPEPMGEALELIGRTAIPSHAITCKVPKGGLKDPVYDPYEEYYDLFWYITLLMYESDDIRNAYLQSKLDLVDMGLQASTTLEGGDPQELFPGYDNLMFYKTMIEDAIQRGGQVLSVMDGSFELPSDIDIFRYALAETSMSDFADPLIDVFVAGADPVGVAVEYLLPELEFPTPQSVLLNYLKVHDESMEGLRALIFNNDDNDGVVRVQSQSGELEKECAECVTPLENVLHGFAPRYASVQSRIVELLEGGMTDFHPMGFPPIDHAQQIYYPPASLDLFKVPKIGGAAICQSGMVPAHALAFAEVADAQNVIIITRPVNPDGTELIARDAATKVMDVKPKSSNWGPQKGYLPVNQRYSKLWKVFEGAERDEKIAEYNTKAQENITDGITVARHLQIDVCNGTYDVFIDLARNTGPGDVSAEDEVYLVPIENPNKVCGWTPNFSSDMIITDCVSRGVQHQLVPFEVMATPDVLEDDGVTPRLLTADYDLLMVGFYKGENQGSPEPPDVPFKPGVGQITPEQEALVEMLNEAVQDADYNGGNVVHHGPENQFSKSPYIDYPLTVFAPDDIPNGFFSGSTGGKILSIEMGPPGYRDINLKQFVNKMRREGYDLYHNPEAPGWKWTWNTTAEAYELEDSKDLNDYVEQLPPNDCDKNGNQQRGICLPVIRPSTTNEKPGSWFGRSPQSAVFSPQSSVQISVSPNPVTDDELHVYIKSNKPGSTQLMISDAVGTKRIINSADYQSGYSEITINVRNLEIGIYSLVLPEYAIGVKFIKL